MCYVFPVNPLLPVELPPLAARNGPLLGSALGFSRGQAWLGSGTCRPRAPPGHPREVRDQALVGGGEEGAVKEDHADPAPAHPGRTAERTRTGKGCQDHAHNGP